MIVSVMSHLPRTVRSAGGAACRAASRSSGLVRAAQELLSSQMSQVTPEEGAGGGRPMSPWSVLSVLASRAPFFRLSAAAPFRAVRFYYAVGGRGGGWRRAVR
mgnify:CR=1 FL=1